MPCYMGPLSPRHGVSWVCRQGGRPPDVKDSCGYIELENEQSWTDHKGWSFSLVVVRATNK
jgi:hypothetical protein